MRRTIEHKRLRDLLRVLDQLRQLHVELDDVVRAKINAMRQADMATLQTVTDSERTIVQRITEREGFRRQLMDAIGEQLGLPTNAARVMSVSQFTARIDRDQAARIVESADRLKEAVAALARTNRMAGVIAKELSNHLQWVWSAVRPVAAQRIGYTSGGAPAEATDARVFETLG